jgi:hypothetical protein
MNPTGIRFAPFHQPLVVIEDQRGAEREIEHSVHHATAGLTTITDARPAGLRCERVAEFAGCTGRSNWMGATGRMELPVDMSTRR